MTYQWLSGSAGTRSYFNANDLDNGRLAIAAGDGQITRGSFDGMVLVAQTPPMSSILILLQTFQADGQMTAFHFEVLNDVLACSRHIPNVQWK